MRIQRLPFQPRRPMANAQRLQLHRRQQLPLRRRADLPGQPLGIVQVTPQPCLQRLYPLAAQHEPQLQRAEPAAQRDTPVTQVLDLAIHRRLQVAGVGAHDPDQVLRVAHVVDRAIEGHAQPFVRVDHQRIGQLDAVPHPAAFRQDHRRAGHGRVHVQPQAMGLGDLADRPQRVEGRGGGSAGGRDHGAGLVAGGQVLLDRRLQCFRAQGMAFVGRDQADVVAAETGQQCGLVHRAVGMGADIDDQRPGLGLQAAAYQCVVAGAFPRADQRHQCAGGCGVLDHPAPLARQAQQLTQPVEGDFLQLAQGRAGLPRQAQHAQASAEEVTEDRRQGAVGGEIAVEVRMLPMGQAGHDQLVDIVEDRGERLALAGGLSGQGGLEIAGFDLGHDRALTDGLAVVGDQVDQLVAVLAELFGGHLGSPGGVVCCLYWPLRG